MRSILTRRFVPRFGPEQRTILLSLAARKTTHARIRRDDTTQTLAHRRPSCTQYLRVVLFFFLGASTSSFAPLSKRTDERATVRPSSTIYGVPRSVVRTSISACWHYNLLIVLQSIYSHLLSAFASANHNSSTPAPANRKRGHIHSHVRFPRNHYHSRWAEKAQGSSRGCPKRG